MLRRNTCRVCKVEYRMSRVVNKPVNKFCWILWSSFPIPLKWRGEILLEDGEYKAYAFSTLLSRTLLSSRRYSLYSFSGKMKLFSNLKLTIPQSTSEKTRQCAVRSSSLWIILLFIFPTSFSSLQLALFFCNRHKYSLRLTLIFFL